MYNIPDRPADNVARKTAKLRIDKDRLAKVDAKYMKLADAQERKLVDFESKAEEAAYTKEARRIKSEWDAARAKLGASPSKNW